MTKMTWTLESGSLKPSPNRIIWFPEGAVAERTVPLSDPKWVPNYAHRPGSLFTKCYRAFLHFFFP
ncbi:MAG: hypothetical protein M3Q77_09210 [Thermoproteota archaeon]|nr:hypothetical protein [Thermoproteota archaeon]